MYISPNFFAAFTQGMASLTLFPQTSYLKWLRLPGDNEWEGLIRDWYVLGMDVQRAILKCGPEELRVEPSNQPERTKTLSAAR